MAEEIKQVLGFDASQALTALTTLDAALAKLESRLGMTTKAFAEFNAQKFPTSKVNNLASAINNLNNVFSGQSHATAAMQKTASATQNTTQAAQSTASALTAVGVAGQLAGQKVSSGMTRSRSRIKAATEEAGRFTTSLQLLSRIVFTQAIIRALSTLRNSFKATAAEAVQFQRQLALIRTIDDSGQSLESLSIDVRKLSDEFNIPLLEAAAGVYQTISNQVGNTAESLQFTAEAARFAKSTNSQLADSVDLLSGALKSYNLGIEDTDRVASVFFKTIDLGRITADQLANSFGRVGPAAAAAGVELEEVGAALAAISVRGSNTPETLTQFRNIVTALIKPSEAMKKAIRDMGFESGESAIRTLTFAGVLRELSERTRGSSTAMAALFPNIRGLNGVTALTNDELATLAANIDEMRVAGEKFADEKFLVATATDAEKVTAEINRLKNAIVVELGQALLDLAARAINTGDAFGDLIGVQDGFVRTIEASGPAILGMAVSLGTLATAMKAATIAGVALNPALAGALLIPAAAGATKSIVEFFDRLVEEKATQEFRDRMAKSEEALKNFAEVAEKATKAANDADKERALGVRSVTRDLVREYLRQQDIVASANDGMVKSTKAALNTITLAYSKLAESQAKAIADSRETQAKAASSISDIQRQQANLTFRQQTSFLSDSQKGFALTKRAAELSSDAAKTLANAAGNQERLNQAAQQFREAEQINAEALAIAQRTGDAVAVARAFKQQRDILDDELRAQRSLLDNEKRRETRLEAVRQKIQDAVALVREQGEIIRDNTGLFDSSGKRFSEAAQAQRDLNRRQASQRLVDISKSFDLNQLRALGVQGIDELEQALKKDPITLQFAIEKGTQDLRTAITQAFEDFRIGAEKLTGIDIGRIEEAFKIEFTAPEEFLGFIDNSIERLAELRSAMDAVSKASFAQDAARGTVNTAFEKLVEARDSQFGALATAGESGQSVIAIYNHLISRLDELRSKTDLTQDDVIKFKDEASAFVNSGGFLERILIGNQTEGKRALTEALTGLKQLQEATAVINQNPVQIISGDIEKFSLVAQQLDQSGFGDKLQLAGQSLNSATAGLQNSQQAAVTIGSSLTNGATALATAATELRSLASTPITIQTQSLQGAFAKGGFVQHFAKGGLARGVDTRPVMARDGEYFINPKSTQRFFSQIQAINAGQNPVYRQNGGSITIGDVNVTVQGGGSDSAKGQASGRAVARALEREVRRGTSRFPRR